MIKSFKHKGLKKFFESGNKKGIQANHVLRLRILLTAINDADKVEDLNAPGFFYNGCQEPVLNYGLSESAETGA